ncbi:glutamyl-tRNA synthetase, partial [Tremellales sp. Uapishka_1]
MSFGLGLNARSSRRDWTCIDIISSISSLYVSPFLVSLYRTEVGLAQTDQAYECFCSPDELSAIRKSLLKQGARHGYDGRCRHFTEEEVGRKKRAGEKYVVRFKARTKDVTLPPDLIFGDAQPTTAAVAQDDFILMKSDGYPTYHLASVVDDHAMDITHVLRGEEWLPSVPKHHELYSAFDWNPPLFGHLPLLVNPDGSKLSKRTGDVRVEHYKEEGYEPEALVNFLALMGWDHHTALSSILQAFQSSPETDTALLPPHARADAHSLYEVFTIDQLVKSFDLGHITHRKAAVNMSKLDFLNKMHLRRKAGRLGEDGLLVDLGKESGLAGSGEEGRAELVERYQEMLRGQKSLQGCALIEDVNYVGKVFDAELARTVKLVDMASSSIFFYLDPIYTQQESQSIIAKLDGHTYISNLKAVIANLGEKATRNSELTEDLVWDAIHEVVQEVRLRKKSDLITPMRHALTGRRAGPSIPNIVAVLGADRSLARLEAAVAYVESTL